MINPLGELLLFIVGNSSYSRDDSPAPEIISISETKNYSKWTSLTEEMAYNALWDDHTYGMVGAVLNELLHVCGGGKFPSMFNAAEEVIEEIRATATCKSFDLKTYTWSELSYSMKESRSFAQSIVFENDTWFIMGGIDSQGEALVTTEYLNINQTQFVTANIRIPERSAKHCAKKINSSHLFTTGGNKSMTATNRGRFHLENHRMICLCKYIYPFLAFILDFSNSMWDYIASMKEARYGHVCGVVNYNQILVAGGTNDIGNALQSTEMFSLISKEWVGATKLPEAIDSKFSLQYGSTVLVIGSGTYQFDETSFEWVKRKEGLSTERSDFVAIPITGIVKVFYLLPKIFGRFCKLKSFPINREHAPFLVSLDLDGELQ